MVRVTVEIVPQGDEARSEILGTLVIINDGTGDAALGNYVGSLVAEYTQAPRTGHVRRFKRQTQSVWSLVGAFLKLWGHTRQSPKDMAEH